MEAISKSFFDDDVPFLSIRGFWTLFKTVFSSFLKKLIGIDFRCPTNVVITWYSIKNEKIPKKKFKSHA